MEMERFDRKASEEYQGAVALICYLAEAFERVSLLSACLGNALQIPKEDIAGAVWLFRVPEARAV